MWFGFNKGYVMLQQFMNTQKQNQDDSKKQFDNILEALLNETFKNTQEKIQLQNSMQAQRDNLLQLFNDMLTKPNSGNADYTKPLIKQLKTLKGQDVDDLIKDITMLNLNDSDQINAIQLRLENLRIKEKPRYHPY